MEGNKEIKPEQVKLVAGFLASAIDMEDEMSRNVYGEFLSRENWPTLLDEESFKNIKELLIVLIRETERHREIFSDLLNKLPGNAKS